jgi:hypothetical protein
MYEHNIRNVQVWLVICTPLNIYLNRLQLLRIVGYMSNRKMKFYKYMTLLHAVVHIF